MWCKARLLNSGGHFDQPCNLFYGAIPAQVEEGGEGGGGDQRRDDLYPYKVRTEIQSVIDYFSLNFCFLADEVLRKAAGNYLFYGGLSSCSCSQHLLLQFSLQFSSQ